MITDPIFKQCVKARIFNNHSLYPWTLNTGTQTEVFSREANRFLFKVHIFQPYYQFRFHNLWIGHWSSSRFGLVFHLQTIIRHHRTLWSKQFQNVIPLYFAKNIRLTLVYIRYISFPSYTLIIQGRLDVIFKKNFWSPGNSSQTQRRPSALFRPLGSKKQGDVLRQREERYGAL